MMTGFLGGMMSAFIEPIRIGLQESVRKVTVRVFWDETGRRDQTIEVVQYLTDPSQIEKACSAAGRAGGAPARRARAGRHAASGPERCPAADDSEPAAPDDETAAHSPPASR